MYITTEQLREKIADLKKKDEEAGGNLHHSEMEEQLSYVQQNRVVAFSSMNKDEKGNIHVSLTRFVPVSNEVWTDDRIALDIAQANMDSGISPKGEELPTWLGDKFFRDKYERHHVPFEKFLATLT